jgi:hypothetical protein
LLYNVLARENAREKSLNNLPYGFCPIHKGDYTKLDIASWKHVDEVLKKVEESDTVWFNLDGFVPNVGAEMGAQRGDFAAQQIYMRNAVARLAPYWNVTSIRDRSNLHRKSRHSSMLISSPCNTTQANAAMQ